MGEAGEVRPGAREGDDSEGWGTAVALEIWGATCFWVRKPRVIPRLAVARGSRKRAEGFAMVG